MLVYGRINRFTTKATNPCVNVWDFSITSHSPHYHAEPARRPLYHNSNHDGSLKAGYACDDRAGLLFINGVMKKSVSLDSTNNNYFVALVDGKIKEDLLPAEILKY
jgi:hypothetical protein